MRILAFDAGFNMGWAALGGGKDPASGSRRVRGDAQHLGVAGRHVDGIIREIILQERPGVIVFAAPFVGSIKGRPVQPNSIRPLMSFLTIIEMVCEELRIRCLEFDEPECRRAFMAKVPRKSKDIKLAVRQACIQRGWPACDDHAADALCVASRALEILNPGTAHEMTPLFQAAPVPAPRAPKRPKRGK